MTAVIPAVVLDIEENVIQSELEKFHIFTQANKLVINRKKCFVMKFSRSKKYDFPAELTLGGSETLEMRKEHTILGIKVQNDLKWQSQCDEMVERATGITWALAEGDEGPGGAPGHPRGVLEVRGQGPASPIYRRYNRRHLSPGKSDLQGRNGRKL